MCMFALKEQNNSHKYLLQILYFKFQGQSQNVNGLYSHTTTHLCTQAHIDRFDNGHWGHVIMAVKLK